MEDIRVYEEYLITDESGNIKGVKEEAPQNVKILYRTWWQNEQDKERLGRLFTGVDD